jgi:N12 class adenine-specific DNA methylase
MAQLTGKTEDALEAELSGVIFRDIQCEERANWIPIAYTDLKKFRVVSSDEYLSGNVRRKLRMAKAMYEALPEGEKYKVRANVEALEAAQPKDLEASEIDLRLGATWLDKSYVQQFMYELFQTTYQEQQQIHVEFSAFTGDWSITGKTKVSAYSIAANTTYGTSRLNAYDILEDTLNLRDVRVYDTVREGDKERRVLNQEETTLAAQKQQMIKDAFRDWIWRDPARRQDLVRQYNELFNSIRPREYDGRHIVFGGINPEITLREHQVNAIAHTLYGGNTLLAHEVGAGKTFEMIAAAMESKRLGLCRKSLFAVPNHLVEQWASEFLRLYPSANILVTRKKDFEKANRKKFCARIATGNYDAIIMGHSQFERLPVSYERRETLLQDQIMELEQGIDEMNASGAERFSVKQLERTKRSLEARLEKLQATNRKDDVVTFEQLGVDRLFVDEAHSYKNLFLYTKMRNVAGLSTTDAQKSSDMLLKCRYMDEITGGRGVVFATGTPVSNSMTELFTMQRYLQQNLLEKGFTDSRGRHYRLTHFDSWASIFGETVTTVELAPEGKYRPRTRFARFFNLPELMAMFRETADIKTADQLRLPVPEVEYHTVKALPSEEQKELVKQLAERAAAIHSGQVDPRIDNMLAITNDGRKLGLDQRLINPLFPDNPESKVNLCVNNVFRIWQEGRAERLTQLLFCDLSTPKAAAAATRDKTAMTTGNKTAGGTELHALGNLLEDIKPDPPFSVYEDIRKKLVSLGIPEREIAFIHDANTDAKKKTLFSKVRAGQVRVLMGSTFKMGAGMNVQDRLIALHDLDCRATRS